MEPDCSEEGIHNPVEKKLFFGTRGHCGEQFREIDLRPNCRRASGIKRRKKLMIKEKGGVSL